MNGLIPILSITLFLPLAGAAALFFVKPENNPAVNRIAVVSAVLTLAGVLLIGIRGVDSSYSGMEQINWIPSLGASYRLGVDGISYPVVLLTGILFLCSIIYSMKIRKRPAAFMALVLMLETSCLGVFMSLDLLLFYVFFEVTLVGMYFIIAGWGHEHRKKAAIFFFIYTLVGSLLLLLALLSLYLHASPHTFDMRELIGHPPVTGTAAALTFWALFLAFAIKTPLFPFHSWLPLAHTEAPAAGSAILAGILLKLGAYGFIRFALQMTPDAFREFAWVVIAVAVISVVYGALVALAQSDIKRMVAYTSINHMGYLVFGIAVTAVSASGTAGRALDGAVLQMVSHGIVTGLLFLLVGAIQDRTVTREMPVIKGLLVSFPVLAGLFIVAAFASLGLPGLAHFPAEFQIFLGGFDVYPVAVAIMLTGLILTSALYLRAIQRSFMGSPETSVLKNNHDMNARELWAMVPLVILTIVIGIFPDLILSIIHKTTELLAL